MTSKQVLWQRAHVAAGLCSQCSRKQAKGYTRCREHLASERRRTGSKPWKKGSRGRKPGPINGKKV